MARPKLRGAIGRTPPVFARYAVRCGDPVRSVQHAGTRRRPGTRGGRRGDGRRSGRGSPRVQPALVGHLAATVERGARRPAGDAAHAGRAAGRVPGRGRGGPGGRPPDGDDAAAAAAALGMRTVQTVQYRTTDPAWTGERIAALAELPALNGRRG